MNAGVAPMAERRFRKADVGGSTPLTSSIPCPYKRPKYRGLLPVYLGAIWYESAKRFDRAFESVLTKNQKGSL